MTKSPNLPRIGIGQYLSTMQVNVAFEAIEEAFQNTLSLDGSTPNSMQADLDMDSNDILNVGLLSADDITVDGSSVLGVLERAEGAADRAEGAADRAEDAADRIDLGAFDADVAATAAARNAAEAARDLAEAWAESATEPDGAGTKSAKTWAGEAEAERILAETAKSNAEVARDAALLSRGVFVSTAEGLSNGVAAVTVTAAGTSGTDGVFALAFSGGAGTGAAGTFTVSGGSIVSVTITHPGTGYTSAPTPDFTASSGLTGVTATVAIAPRNPVGTYFSVPGTGDDTLILYRVDAGPVAVEVARYPSAAAVGAVLEITDTSAPWYLDTKQVLFGVVDGGGRIVSAVYLDGSPAVLSDGVAFDESEILYAGYQEIAFAVIDSDGGIAAANLRGGQSLEAWAATADLAGNRERIVFLGDSLTQRGYPEMVEALTGRRVTVYARGSTGSRHQAARMGAISVGMSVSGGQIVSGSNTITHINGLEISGGIGPQNSDGNNQFLSRGDSNATDSVRGYLGSVRGTLTRTATGGPPSTTENYTFVPDAGQTLPAKCPPGTPWVSEYPDRDLTHVIWVGSNDLGFADGVDRFEPNIRAMVQALGHRRFLLLNPINRTGDAQYVEGASFWTQTLQFERIVADLGRENFVNIRRALIDQGLARAGITPTSTDLSDIALDTIPTSLKADIIHQNTTGDEVIAEIVAEELVVRGY